MIEIKSGKAKKLLNHQINNTYGSPFSWLPDSKRIICLTVPQRRGEAPIKPRIPEGPVIQENIGKKAPARTYQDLLKSPYDESLFEYYLTSQLVLINLKGDKPSSIGSPSIYTYFSPSPDGKYLLVETIHRPYSYIVPISRFPRKIEVWDLNGKLVYSVADIPLAEEIPIGFNAVRTGPRSVAWQPEARATLFWVEAQDNGNPNNDTKIRDKIFTLSAPFNDTPTPLISN